MFLERQREHERSIIARLRKAIAPVNKLPPELLAEIFLAVRDSYRKENGRERIRKIQALSQICSYWRRAALTTPRLYTGILANTLRTTPSADHLASTKQWLDRSAPFPIPIHLRIFKKHLKSVDAEQLMDVLLMAVERWKSAVFKFDSLDLLFRIPDDSLKSLEQLQLRSTDIDNHSELSVFLTAKKLHRICLNTQCSSKLLLPWCQLSSLNITDPDPLECLNALVQCPALETASFCTRLWEYLPNPNRRPLICLERLKYLTIDFKTMGEEDGRDEDDEDDEPDGYYFIPFIAPLDLPALKTFHLSPSDVPWDAEEFTEFQLRCPNLERLTIVNAGLDSDDLLDILRHAPSLVKLELDACMDCVDESVFLALLYSPTRAMNAAPKLRHINWTYTDSSFNEETLDRMIQSRWWTDDPPLAPQVSRWSSIYIQCADEGLYEEDSHFSPWFAKKLETYREQGLNVSITGYGH
ncbi:F-box domain-containing protein [Favolaschia claudopus]|uniref:F-box domain-containing protein n=1 Tax=Favolaschia claudopus TaxID=2862362 RepID=A0AAW0B9Z7_9AGAR